MKPEMIAILSVLFVFVLLEIRYTRFFAKPLQKMSDAIVELISTLTLSLITQPLVLAASVMLASLLLPGAAGVLEDWPVWGVFILFLLFDDLSQYWWHRLSHSVAFLYRLHRPHHNANYLSIRVVYRNNLFYYLLMPGLWCSGVLIYMGCGEVYLFYIVLKMAVIFAAHSDVRWDQKLYAITWLSPLMWLLERTISTPATHAAHHGKHQSDGITHYKGNYGNLLFFWDVLFKTAKITRQYPSEFGVEDLPETSIGEQLIWPLIRMPQPQEEAPVERAG